MIAASFRWLVFRLMARELPPIGEDHLVENSGHFAILGGTKHDGNHVAGFSESLLQPYRDNMSGLMACTLQCSSLPFVSLTSKKSWQ